MPLRIRFIALLYCYVTTVKSIFIRGKIGVLAAV